MPTDKIGQEIKVGSCVIYSHTIPARSAELRFGKILAIINKSSRRKSTYFTVIGVDDVVFDGEIIRREASLAIKSGRLFYANRMIVLQPEQIPANIKKLLDSYKS